MRFRLRDAEFGDVRGVSGTRHGVAVVAGGSAGVGRAVVRELANAGWDVAVVARGRAGSEAAADDARAAGVKSAAYQVDVADLDVLRETAATVERELGPIALWVNVAFVGALRTFWDTSPELYRRITDVTYFGQVNGTLVALELMRPRDDGVIINVGSALAFRGIPLQSAYCGAKHAVKGFTESVIAELKHEGSRVRVGMVQLPALNTPQFNWNDTDAERHPQPVAPIYQPEVAARAIRALAEHPGRNAWVGLSTAYTILGNRLAPKFLDWYLGKTGVDAQLTDKKGPRHGSNAFQPRDDDADRGARGMFDDAAHARDPWSAVAMRLRALVSRTATRAR
jgi:NAD(P)-dependent dehydrogenase (short-subunit alcohol dehydrogenase family)